MARLFLFVLTTTALLSHSAVGFEKAALAWNLPWDVDWVTAVAFVGPNRVVAGNNIGQLLVWDLPESTSKPAPKPIRRLEGHSNTINRLLVSPDGRWLISASNDHTIRLWDLSAPAAKKDKVVLNARPIAEAEARKKKAPAPVEVEVEVQEAAKTFTHHRDWVTGIAFNKDGNLLASGDEKGEIVVSEFPSGKEVRRWKVKGWVWALALSPDGQTLLASERFPLVFDSGKHSGVKLWNATDGSLKTDLAKTFDKKGMLAAAAFSPDGKTLAVLRGGESDGMSGMVTLLDIGGKVKKELTPGHLNGGTDLVFHPDGKHLASSGRDTQVRIWNVESMKLVKELGSPRGGQFKDWIHAVAFSPDAKYLAAGDMAGQVQIWALKGRD